MKKAAAPEGERRHIRRAAGREVSTIWFPFVEAYETIG